MRTVLITALLFLCVCNGAVFAAQEASTNTVIQGNKGYVYGSALPETEEVANTPSAPAPEETNTPHYGPLATVIHAIHRLDAWIQRNLW